MNNLNIMINDLFSGFNKLDNDFKKEMEDHFFDSISDLQKIGLNEKEAFLVTKERFFDDSVIKEIQFSSSLKKPSLTNLIIIGVSTGGPSLLYKMVSQIKKSTPACILVIQHMPKGSYTSLLASHLNDVCTFDVEEANDGLELCDGKVIIARGGYHLEIENENDSFVCKLSTDDCFKHHPSIDKTLFSLNKFPFPIFVSILTGMGSDGLLGVKHLKENHSNVTIFAESEQTAVVYGMPRQIIHHKLADFVYGSDELLGNILKKLAIK